MRLPLEIRDVAMGQVNFTTGAGFVWVGEHELDSARLTIRRFGVAYVRGNGIDESDVIELHNAIRKGSA